KPLSKIKKIRLDRDSKTSNALLEVLFKNYLKQEVEFVFDENLSQKTDAELLIGDKALLNKSRFKNKVLDLGDCWFQWTKLPFVFAAWMIPRDLKSESTAIVTVLKSAYQMGKTHLNAVIASVAKE